MLKFLNSFKFSDIFKRPAGRDLSKQEYTLRPAPRKLTGGLAANEKLLKGIYSGAAQDFALSSYMSQGMIETPKSLVGIPDIILGEDEDGSLIQAIAPLVLDEYPLIVQTMLVTGTAWRWARWSDANKRLVWEALPDSSVTAIDLDLDALEITGVYTDELIEYNNGEDAAFTHRKRHITKTAIAEEWTGGMRKKAEYRNVFGWLPIPFGHNCWEGEWRGNSVFAKALRILKSSHDIAYKRDEILSEFDPKIVQTVQDVQAWIKNNTEGVGSAGKEFDPFGRKLFVNQNGESTSYIGLPSGTIDQYTNALKDNQLKIIMGSGIPELFFGQIATGNMASSDTDVRLAAEYVKGVRRELMKGTEELINQSLSILAYMRFRSPPKVTVAFGTMNMLSAMQKAQVLGAYAAAMSALLQTASVTPKGAYFLTKEIFPDYPVKDENDFLDGLSEMLVHTSKIGQGLFEAGDIGGGF
jgi:hypothetical protein